MNTHLNAALTKQAVATTQLRIMRLLVQRVDARLSGMEVKDQLPYLYRLEETVRNAV